LSRIGKLPDVIESAGHYPSTSPGTAGGSGNETWLARCESAREPKGQWSGVDDGTESFDGGQRADWAWRQTTLRAARLNGVWNDYFRHAA